MGDNPLDQLLPGDEPADGQAPPPTEPAPSTDLAAAVAMQQENRDPASAAATTRFLRRQASLLTLQTKQLKEEQPLRLDDLRLRNLSQKLRIALQGAVIVAAAAAIIVGLALLWGALSAQSVVVEAFDTSGVPPAQGLTGVDVAERVLDALNGMQTATRGRTPKRSLEDAWSNDIRLEVPDTGVTIGDLEKFLKARLGHETRISGSLTQSADGRLELVVRGNGLSPVVFSSPPAQFHEVIVQAAEYIYRRLQPANYFRYLIISSRDEEVVAEAPSALPGASATDRKHILNDWANALENTAIVGADNAGTAATSTSIYRQARGLYQRAIAIDPHYWDARSNLINNYILLQDEDGARHAASDMLRLAGRRPGDATESDWEPWDLQTWNLGPARAARVSDAQANSGLGTDTVSAYVDLALLDAWLHNTGEAQFDLDIAASQANGPDAPSGAANSPIFVAMRHFVSALIYTEQNRPQAAAAEMEQFAVLYRTKGQVSSNYPTEICWLAPAEEAAGQRQQADAAMTGAPSWPDCLRFRADILNGRGDWPGARAGYEAAIDRAPYLPAAHYSYGLALKGRGALSEAIQEFERANADGPTWAEPLEAWGDALAAQGRFANAVEKYEAAIRLAPTWKAAQDALGTARSHEVARH